MLTATYSIMVLKSEQRKARSLVSSLEQFLQRDAHRAADHADLAWLRQGAAKLTSAYDYCCARKVDLYLVPAVRKLAGGTHALLDNLDTRTLYSARILDFVRKQTRRAADNSAVDTGALLASMQLYCKQMHERFLVEDGELLPLACRVLTEGDWFTIASQCLSHVGNSAAKINSVNPVSPVNAANAASRPQAEPVLAH